MSWFLWLTAAVQTIQDRMYGCIGRCRRRLLPIAKYDGYDMVLLQSGYWIMTDIDTARIPASHIKARYNAETHTIVSDHGPKMKRWDWLGVVTADGKDISDFFCGLRYTIGLSLDQSDVLFLFAHQKGWYPNGAIEITFRSGDIDHVWMFSGVRRIVSNSEINSADLNYIK